MMRAIFYFDEGISEADIASAADLHIEIESRRHNLPEMRIEAWPGHVVNRGKSTDINSVRPTIVSFSGTNRGVPVELPPHTSETLFSREREVFGYKTVSFWIRVSRQSMQTVGPNIPYSTIGDFKNVTFLISATGSLSNRLKAVVLWFNEDPVAIIAPLQPAHPARPGVKTVVHSIASTTDIFQSWLDCNTEDKSKSATHTTRNGKCAA
jgi:hypothetical protein